jgi:hypothetical protein
MMTRPNGLRQPPLLTKCLTTGKALTRYQRGRSPRFSGRLHPASTASRASPPNELPPESYQPMGVHYHAVLGSEAVVPAPAIAGRNRRSRAAAGAFVLIIRRRSSMPGRFSKSSRLLLRTGRAFSKPSRLLLRTGRAFSKPFQLLFRTGCASSERFRLVIGSRCDCSEPFRLLIRTGCVYSGLFQLVLRTGRVYSGLFQLVLRTGRAYSERIQLRLA